MSTDHTNTGSTPTHRGRNTSPAEVSAAKVSGGAPSADPRLQQQVRRWLVAESSRQWLEAEAALRGVFQLLPTPALPEDFPRRVLRSAGMTPATDWFSRRWVRWAVAVCFLVVGGLASLLPGAVIAVAETVTPTTVSTAASGLAGAVAGGLTGGLAILEKIAEIGGLTLRAALTPSALLLFGTFSLLTLAAFRLLTDWIVEPGRSGHAEPA
ncbi:MAG: hypothetical protein SX243_18275 [Acidobacteriota bacterium]|nr:hypothetical protein [Acidobacteriota bacterium]